MAGKLNKVDQAQREARLVDYASMSWPWEAIMAAEGYKTQNAAMKATRAALNKIKSPTVNQVRAKSDQRADYLIHKMTSIVENPPPVHSATGTLTPDPSTCTCGNRLVKYMSDHAPDCQVQPVYDTQRVIAAAEVIRKVDGENRKLHAADKSREIPADEAMRQVQEFLSRYPVQPPQTWQAEILAVEAAEHTDPMPVRYVADRRPADGQDEEGNGVRA